MVTITTPNMQQDHALRLLAQMYSRWFMRSQVGSEMENVFAQIRDVFYQAASPHEAYEQLSHFADVSEPEGLPQKAYDQARVCVKRLVQSGGNADALIAGQTDGYRHLCLTCGQDEQNFQRVRFFDMQSRRPLLYLEVGDVPRTAYARCQLCLQPLNPQRFVLLMFGGTAKHIKPCACGQCNRAGTGYLVNIYECEKSTQQVIFPFLQQVTAPSRQKGVERAIELCWENGWFMLNKEKFLPV